MSRLTEETYLGPTDLARLLGESRAIVQDNILAHLDKPAVKGQYLVHDILKNFWERAGGFRVRSILGRAAANEAPAGEMSLNEAKRLKEIEAYEKLKIENERKRGELIPKDQTLESIREIAMANRASLEDFLVNQVPKLVVGMEDIGEIRNLMKPELNRQLERMNALLDTAGRGTDTPGYSENLEVEP